MGVTVSYWPWTNSGYVGIAVCMGPKVLFAFAAV